MGRWSQVVQMDRGGVVPAGGVDAVSVVLRADAAGGFSYAGDGVALALRQRPSLRDWSLVVQPMPLGTDWETCAAVWRGGQLVALVETAGGPGGPRVWALAAGLRGNDELVAALPALVDAAADVQLAAL